MVVARREKIKFRTITPHQRLDTLEQLKSLVADYSDDVAQVLPGEMTVNEVMEGLTKDTGIKRMNEMLMQGKVVMNGYNLLTKGCSMYFKTIPQTEQCQYHN